MTPVPVRDQLPKTVASTLGVSVDSVGRYARDGIIPFATTPKGHRRYNLDEVQAALHDLDGPDLSRLRPVTESRAPRLALGPPVTTSPASRRREQLRATRTAASESRRTEPAFAGVLGHARRVLVATGS